MTDEIFMAWLHGFAYARQREGYGTYPVPDSFLPIVPYFRNEDGTINREKTLEGGSFTSITGVQRENLLKST